MNTASEKTVGARLRACRALEGLSQQELAERAQVDQSLISYLEHDQRPRVSALILARIARVLGVTTSQLLGETPLFASRAREASEASENLTISRSI